MGKAVLLVEKYEVLEEWVPAFAGTTMGDSRIQQSIVNMPIIFGVTLTA